MAYLDTKEMDRGSLSYKTKQKYLCEIWTQKDNWLGQKRMTNDGNYFY